MNDNKDFDKSKLDAAEIKLTHSSPLLAKLENFWYYHKWKVIVITFFAIVLIVGIAQVAGKTEPDATIVIAVPETVTPLQSVDIGTALVPLMPGDSNGDGKKSVDVVAYAIYSEDEMYEANHTETETEKDGGWHYVPTVNQSYNVEKFEEYTEYLKTGEATILFVSEYLYSNLVVQERVRPLSDIFGENLPAGALADGYGVRLGDLGVYDYVEALKVLPEDTVVCLLRPYIWGASSKEEKYSYCKELFKKIVSFSE